MWPHGVVVLTPALDQYLGLPECAEHFAVQQLIPELAVEGLDIAVLPRTAGLDVGGLGTDAADPVPGRRRGRGVERRSGLGAGQPEPPPQQCRSSLKGAC